MSCYYQNLTDYSKQTDMYIARMYLIYCVKCVCIYIVRALHIMILYMYIHMKAMCNRFHCREGTVSVDDARTVCGSLDLTLCQADIDEHIQK